MKTETLNPWLIIRWAFVVALFAGTVAVAVDQVRTKDKAIAEARAEIARHKAAFENLTNEARELGKEAAEYAVSLQQIEGQLDAIKTQVQYNQALKKTEDTAAAVLRTQAVLTQAQPGRVQAIPAAGKYVAPQSARGPVIPQWYPPAPSVVAKTIRDNAIAEHKDDYSALNYEITRQTEGYEKLLRYYKTADPFIKGVINKAALDYGSKYSMIAYEVDREIEARKKFQAR